MSWRDFWLYSAELANEALRNNFECDELFYDTYEYYKLKMKEMEFHIFHRVENSYNSNIFHAFDR